MKKYKSVTIEKLDVDKVICNCCGKEIKIDKFGEIEDYITIKKSWGYNSNFDGEEHEIDICNDCYQKWIEKFEINPNKNM